MTNAPTPDRTYEILAGILELRGPAAGLAYLNDGVPHRYTAIYRLDCGNLRSVHLHDKRGEIMQSFLAEVPLGDSFCQFVLRDGISR
ncbi:hypothetical protein [Pseudorhodoferax sp. Leaf267]|uniref:hypothetical protein n=1 Tax=Pseudorhodoferax sp. Leaf267 TaxID=1736316 RepID=UPI00071627BA|nr:hypothetical protein [Pseudorhodoferax sp. Leaf267]KQP15186.1 hypothetical protein ASF43_14275 [Pseudorhodoferax sp. Leaf267]